MTSVDSLTANLQKFEAVFSSLKPGTVDLICFPENCLYLRVKDTENIEKFELTHSCFMWLGEWARRLGCALHLGSVPLILGGRLFNSSVWITEEGNAEAGYQKIHLFDIELEGQKPIRESDVFERGSSSKIRELKGWRIGESICYDIRFSELYSDYAHHAVDILLIPAAFLVETGRAHWEVLNRARAIESQCYVVASAQAGVHQSLKNAAERRTYGHSLIVEPWGQVLADLGLEPGVQIHHLQKESIQKVRNQIPMASHRRGRKDNFL
jgi:predicted amidohydrolase